MLVNKNGMFLEHAFLGSREKKKLRKLQPRTLTVLCKNLCVRVFVCIFLLRQEKESSKVHRFYHKYSLSLHSASWHRGDAFVHAPLTLMLKLLCHHWYEIYDDKSDIPPHFPLPPLYNNASEIFRGNQATYFNSLKSTFF